MAWSEKLPSGKYRGMYRDARGHQRSTGRVTFTHKRPALAAAVAAESKARRTSGADPKEAKRPWGDWARDVWWDARDVEPGTLKRDLSRKRTHLEPQFAAVPIGQISKMDVRDWMTKMKKAGVSNSTRNRALRLFSASMRYAAERDVIDVNPCTGVRAATETKGQERYLTREEFGSILAQLPTETDQLVAMTLAFTGMRWSEMTGLHWQRVDLGASQIVVAETYLETTNRIKPYPKSKKPRPIPVVPALHAALTARMLVGGTCEVVHMSGKCRSQLVFTSERGRPLRNSKWSRRWRAAVLAAGLEGVKIHDLRHTYASWLLQAGVSIAEVSKLLGHASITTTERYAHLAETPSDAVVAALVLDSGALPSKSIATLLPHEPDSKD